MPASQAGRRRFESGRPLSGSVSPASTSVGTGFCFSATRALDCGMAAGSSAPRPSSSARQRTLRQVLLLEAAAFVVVIAIIWLDELIDLPHRLFGAPRSPARVAEGLTESLLLFMLAVTILTVTARAFRRILQLESYLVLCAWCRRVRVDGEWQSFETFLSARETRTSHGICADCASRIDPPKAG